MVYVGGGGGGVQKDDEGAKVCEFAVGVESF